MHSRFDRFRLTALGAQLEALIAQPERYVEFAALSRVGVAAIGAIQHEIAHKFPKSKPTPPPASSAARWSRSCAVTATTSCRRAGGSAARCSAMARCSARIRNCCLSPTSSPRWRACPIGSPRAAANRAVDTPPRRHGLLARRACVPPARSRRGVRRAHRRRTHARPARDCIRRRHRARRATRLSRATARRCRHGIPHGRAACVQPRPRSIPRNSHAAGCATACAACRSTNSCASCSTTTVPTCSNSTNCSPNSSCRPFLPRPPHDPAPPVVFIHGFIGTLDVRGWNARISRPTCSATARIAQYRST